MKRLQLGTGATLAVREHGRGEAVLLLHAWGETHHTFDRLIPLLADSLHLIVPDLRGSGASSKPETGYALDDYVADVIALLDALELDACWLLGTSSGGYLAQALAVDHPHRVSGIIAVGSPSDLRSVSAEPLRAQLDTFHDPVTTQDIENLHGALPLLHEVPAEFLEAQFAAALSIPTRAWREGFEGLVAATPPLQRGPITVPTLILWGAEDGLLPAEQLRDFSTNLSNVRVITYADTAHLVLWEVPQRVATDTLDFVLHTPR